MKSDHDAIIGKRGLPLERSLDNTLMNYQQSGFVETDIKNERVYDDYSADFNYRDLYHKLCFEQMLTNFDKFLDFELFYQYINKLGKSIEVLRIPTLVKTKLKSNHYYVMVLMTKLTNLRVVKLHGTPTSHTGPDFFKFLLKGMNYMAKAGRQLQKIQMNKLLGTFATSSDYLYPCLKPNSNIISLDFSD